MRLENGKIYQKAQSIWSKLTNRIPATHCSRMFSCTLRKNPMKGGPKVGQLTLTGQFFFYFWHLQNAKDTRMFGQRLRLMATTALH